MKEVKEEQWGPWTLNYLSWESSVNDRRLSCMVHGQAWAGTWVGDGGQLEKNCPLQRNDCSAQLVVTCWNVAPSQIWLFRGSCESDFHVASPRFQILATNLHLFENSVSLIECELNRMYLWMRSALLLQDLGGGWLLLCVGSRCWWLADEKLLFDKHKMAVWEMTPVFNFVSTLLFHVRRYLRQNVLVSSCEYVMSHSLSACCLTQFVHPIVEIHLWQSCYLYLGKDL